MRDPNIHSVAEWYTVDGRWDDDDVIGYLQGEQSPADEIESAIYRLVYDGVPDEKPCQERCDRYDGPFSEDGPDRLRNVAGILVYASIVFDPIDDADLEDSGPVIDAD